MMPAPGSVNIGASIHNPPCCGAATFTGGGTACGPAGRPPENGPKAWASRGKAGKTGVPARPAYRAYKARVRPKDRARLFMSCICGSLSRLFERTHDAPVSGRMIFHLFAK